MESLALKLVLAPALIGAASLAGRRWGPAVSGWLVGLPLTSGPIAFFLRLDGCSQMWREYNVLAGRSWSRT